MLGGGVVRVPVGGRDAVSHSIILAWFRIYDLEFDRIKTWLGAIMDTAYQEAHTTLYNCLCFANLCHLLAALSCALRHCLYY